MTALPRVLVIGGGEMGSAVAHRLRRLGFEVWIAEIEKPKCIRRLVCFASACYGEDISVEGMKARRSSLDEAADIAAAGEIPVIAEDFRGIALRMRPDVIVDARMLKRESDISRDLAPLVIGLGPGFVAGFNVDVVIETNRGHNLGRVIEDGEAEAATGQPAPVMGFGKERVVRAPAQGVFKASARIGDIVAKGAIIGMIDDFHKVEAPIGGLVRGLVADGVMVERNQKIGDIDPRGRSIRADTISDKGRAISGGVLEAILRWYWYDRKED